MYRSVVFFGIFLLIVTATPASGQGSTQSVQGRIRGVAAVNLRERPSIQSRSVTSLAEGEQVEIQKIDNGWALVRTARGENGYLRVGYLAAPQDALVRLESATTTEQPTQNPTGTVSEPRSAPESELMALRSELEELRRQATLNPETAGEQNLQEIRRDLRTILEQTSSIDRKLQSNSPIGELGAPIQANPNFSWALLGFGAVIGLFLGVAIGRRQERKKRTRIRI